MQHAHTSFHRRRLNQILERYNPGKTNLAQLRVRYRTDRSLARELESMYAKAQRDAAAQIEEFRPTIH